MATYVTHVVFHAPPSPTGIGSIAFQKYARVHRGGERPAIRAGVGVRRIVRQ